VRWEKVTRLFLRTTEFLWQEGHTVHATAEEAEAETLQMLGIYRKLAEEYLAIPVLTGRKSDSEKFAGAVRTYAIEMLMPDGKALQAGTSHNLGQNFAKAFNIRYESKEQKLEYAWQTSWGATTRLVGALVMTHGDDSGLILPPRVAPIQAVIVPISAGNWQETVLPQARKIFTELKGAGLRVHLDDRDAYTPGWKYADWEMRGVPVRIEIGPKDIEKQQVVLVSRIDRKKSFVPWSGLADELKRLLEKIQGDLYAKALAFRDGNTHPAGAYAELLEAMAGSRGFIRCGWCGSPDCEAKVKADTSATIRVILDAPDPHAGQCVVCSKPAPHTVIFAKSY
jgi:prolyl-tRNA synthetase